MFMFHPFLNMIPLSGCLALLISFLMGVQLTKELTEKLDEMEAMTSQAVNTSRECGKDVANKTVIAMSLNRTIEFMMKELKEINKVNITTIHHANVDNKLDKNIDYHDKEAGLINSTNDKIENAEQMKNNGEMLKKTKVRQNRLQMYGVIVFTIVISLLIILFSLICIITTGLTGKPCRQIIDTTGQVLEGVGVCYIRILL